MTGVRPDLTPAETEAIIEQTAMDVGAQGKDPQFGAGIINADGAVRAAVAFQRPAPPPPDTRKVVRFFWGRFGFTRRITTVGNWRLRVAFGGSTVVKPGGSLSVKVKAIPRRS